MRIYFTKHSEGAYCDSMTKQARKTPPLSFLNEIVLDSGRNLPLHAQLRLSLERFILEHCKDQERFYSESQLTTRLKVSQGTVRRALADLVTQGLLEIRPAWGAVVRKQSGNLQGFHNLAVFLPDYSSPNIAKVLSLINEQCLDRNVRLLPIYTHRGERLLKAYNTLKFNANEGKVILIENSPRITAELAAALDDKGYDCVLLGTLLKNSPCKFVGTSDQAAIELGLKHLIELGHRKITLLVNEPEEKESVQERIAAFQAYPQKTAIPLDLQVGRVGVHLWNDQKKALSAAMKQIMEPANRPTAIFAVSDMGALLAIQWLQRHNFKVPDEISVMGTDGIELGELYHPTLTTTVHPLKEIVRVAFGLFDDPVPKHRQLFIPPTLAIRESTSRPH